MFGGFWLKTVLGQRAFGRSTLCGLWLGSSRFDRCHLGERSSSFVLFCWSRILCAVIVDEGRSLLGLVAGWGENWQEIVCRCSWCLYFQIFQAHLFLTKASFRIWIYLFESYSKTHLIFASFIIFLTEFIQLSMVL